MLSLAAVVGTATAQSITSAQDRDTHENFKLKTSSAEAKILGPIYKMQSTWVFDNPQKKLTEAAVNFLTDPGQTLFGFGYWYKDEFVPGVLMDKEKAWFIYTAITSRDRDPGIVDQVADGVYHAQVYPLAVGYDFRLKLDTVGMLPADSGGTYLPQPRANDGSPKIQVASIEPERLDESGDRTQIKPLPEPTKLDMHAQRFKDGRYYVVGSLGKDGRIVEGLEGVLYARVGESGRYFAGYRRGKGTIRVTSPHGPISRRMIGNDTGGETAKIWANMKLVQHPPRTRKSLVRFSLKYGIPSQATALLAVPEAEMKAYREREAENRRRQRENKRDRRNWTSERSQNWQNSNGGDPEIRVSLPEAERAYAVLPDGRTFDLFKTADGFWGGNYDIPADAAEGNYVVRAIGVRADGSKVEATVEYLVDRTPPRGVVMLDEKTLVVRSEPGLARVVAVTLAGAEIDFVEKSPGLYRLESAPASNVLKVLLLDRAHNRTFLQWSR